MRILKLFNFDLKKIAGNKYFFLIIILLIAVFFRFFNLSVSPPGLYPDVAMNGMDAISANETGQYSVFYPANNGREGLFINLIAISFKIFGESIWSLRIVGSTVGVLAVLGLYFLAKELFSRRIALFSSFFLATSFWHVNFSRIGFRAILVPTIMIWGFFLLFRAIKSQKWWLWIISGVILGLGFYSYIAYKIVPLLIISLLFIWTLKEKNFLKKNYLKITVFVLVLGLAYLPLYQYFKTNPDVVSRTGQVSVFNPEVNKGNLIGTLAKTTALGLGMLNFYGDPNWRHNVSGWPMVNILVGLGFLIGIFIIIKNLFKSHLLKGENIFIFLFIFAWFFAMLLPAILTEEGMPHSLRAIGVFPAVILISAWSFDWIYEKLKIKIQRFNLKIGVIAVFFLIILMDFYQYFGVWAKNPEVHGAFNENLTNIGEYLLYLKPDTKKYVIVNEPGVTYNSLPVTAQTVKFTTYKKVQDLSYILPEDLTKIASQEENLFFILMKYDEKIIEKLEERYPQGLTLKMDFNPGMNSDFWVYDVTQ